MKKQVFYIHGGDAFSIHEQYLDYLRTVPIRGLPGTEVKSLWSKNLSEDLGEEYEVYTPVMPNKHNASYEEWSIWFERHFEYLRDRIVLVGWSLGGMFLAKYLAEHELPFIASKLILVAAPCGECLNTNGDDCGSFQFSAEILTTVPEKVNKITLFHSIDDFVVPVEQLAQYHKVWPDAKIVKDFDKNHYLIEQFHDLLTEIREP